MREMLTVTVNCSKDADGDGGSPADQRPQGAGVQLPKHEAINSVSSACV